jgi:hypothetical protein
VPAPRTTKTYVVATGPNASTAAVVPANPFRIAVFIQNTGANPGLARFGGPVQANGSDMAFTAGQSQKWDQADTCPQDALTFQSTAATTWCVIETVAPR